MKLEVFWQQLVGTGSEHLILDTGGMIHADSIAIGELDGNSYRIRYEIDCDAGWSVQRLRIEDLQSEKVLVLRRESNEHWFDEAGHLLPELSGCTEVDIMVTPFTNTLPIKRLNLKPGETREILVAYVQVIPELTLSSRGQRYTFVSLGESGNVYRYESLESGFQANLKVDSDSLVTDYPDIFKLTTKRRFA